MPQLQPMHRELAAMQSQRTVVTLAFYVTHLLCICAGKREPIYSLTAALIAAGSSYFVLADRRLHRVATDRLCEKPAGCSDAQLAPVPWVKDNIYCNGVAPFVRNLSTKQGGQCNHRAQQKADNM